MAPTSTRRPPRRTGTLPLLTLLAVLLVGLNLRGPIAAVGPVVDRITADLALSPTTAGLLVSLPVLCFAGAAPLAARLGRRLGPVRAVGWATVVLVAALVVRVLTGSTGLLVGTVVVGLAMTVGNVLLPVVVKRDFPGRVTSVMAAYTATLAGGAALAAALTAPLAGSFGWRGALAAGGVPAVLALGVWAAAFRGSDAGLPASAAASDARPRTPPDVEPHAHGRSVWRQPTAWAVGLVLGFQSFLYYALTSWLPLLLQEDAGLGPASAGNAMSLFQLLGIPATLVVPALSRRRPTQGWLGLLLGSGWLVMVLGLLVAPQLWLLWSLVGGVTQGLGISFAFTLVVLRAQDPESVRELSAMSQFVGYGVGALGPVVVGALRTATGSWAVPLLVLVAAAVLLGAAGAVAGRDRPVVAGAARVGHP